MDQDEKYYSDLLKKIFSPGLLILGLIGNITSLIIFSQKSMKKYTTFRYLFLLSIIDICSLYTGCSQIMLDVYFEIDIRLINEFSCKVQSFLVYFFTHLSSMLLAIMSIDRTITITFKLRTFSTPKTAVKLFLLISLVIFITDSHFLLFTHLYTLEIPIGNDSDINILNYLSVNNTCKKYLNININY